MFPIWRWFLTWCGSTALTCLYFIFPLYLSCWHLSFLILFYVLLLFYVSFIHLWFIYEEVYLPMYVKGWSGGLLSLKGSLGKVRFLCYRVYLVLHELMQVSIFLMQVIFSMNLVTWSWQQITSYIYSNLYLKNTIPIHKCLSEDKSPKT